MDLVKAMGNVEFSDADRERVLSLSPFIKENSGKIIDEVISVVAKDERVLNILEKNGITAADAKKAWMGALEMLFSEPMNDKMIRRMFEIGVVHVDKEVNEELVIEAMSLFMLKTLETLSAHMEVSKELYFAVVKLFAVALSAMITSYNEEQERRKEALLKSLGISGNLLKRHIELGKKYNK